MDREAAGYALLFGLPPGAGVAGFVTYATGGGTLTPLAALIGGGVALAVVSLVYVAAATDGRVDRTAPEGA